MYGAALRCARPNVTRLARWDSGPVGRQLRSGLHNQASRAKAHLLSLLDLPASSDALSPEKVRAAYLARFQQTHPDRASSESARHQPVRRLQC